MNPALSQKLARTRLITLALLLTTIAFMTIESAVGHNELMPRSAFLIWIAVKTGPLLAFIPAVAHVRARSLAWMGFVIVLYLLVAAMQTFEPGVTGHLAIARCVLLTATLTASSFLARWQSQSSAITESGSSQP